MSTDVKLKYGDIEFYNGDPVLLTKNDKLIQDLGKIILTEKQGAFHPDYGCDIYSLIGQYERTDILDILARKHIVDSVNYLVGIQYRQGLNQQQDVEEILAKIESVRMGKLPNSRDAYYVEVSIRDGTARSLSITIPIKG